MIHYKIEQVGCVWFVRNLKTGAVQSSWFSVINARKVCADLNARGL